MSAPRPRLTARQERLLRGLQVDAWSAYFDTVTEDVPATATLQADVTAALARPRPVALSRRGAVESHREKVPA